MAQRCHLSKHVVSHDGRVFQGPDVVRLLSDLGTNSFDGFGALQAKQYVVCNDQGQIISDSVLFCEEENKVSIVGWPMAANWLRYHVAKGDYDVTVAHVGPPSPNLTYRQRFRFQVQGPNADKLMEELNGGPLPDIPFFKMGRFKIGPHEVVALTHRMSGALGRSFRAFSPQTACAPTVSGCPQTGSKPAIPLLARWRPGMSKISTERPVT